MGELLGLCSAVSGVDVELLVPPVCLVRAALMRYRTWRYAGRCLRLWAVDKGIEA